jgi:hypothetical protein
LTSNADAYPALTQFIGDTIETPPNKIDVPDCTGMTIQQCLAALEAAGFQGVHHTVTLNPDEAVQGLPPLTIVETDPRRRTQVDVDGDIIIRRNPRPEDFPVRVPNIVPGEDVGDAQQAIIDADLSPHITRAPAPDPTVGPDQVTRTAVDPVPGSDVARGTSINVEVNPSDAPWPPGTGPGGGKSIDLSPLSAITPCTKFPFGVPCWINDALGGWSVAGHAPVVDLAIPYFDKSWHVDLSVMQPVVDIMRPLLLLASLLGLGLLFMRLTGGFGGGGKGDE